MFNKNAGVTQMNIKYQWFYQEIGGYLVPIYSDKFDSQTDAINFLAESDQSYSEGCDDLFLMTVVENTQ